MKNVMITGCLLLAVFLTAKAKLASEQAANANDEKYKGLILGRWIEDEDKQQKYNYPVYIEYFSDGSSVVKIFRDETCKESMEYKSYWKILNGNLYYKFDDETGWKQDRIIKVTDTHHVLRSEGEILYRKKGSVCGE